LTFHEFPGYFGDGISLYAGPAMDRAGNLYGSTFKGGAGDCGVGCGVVYQLQPPGAPVAPGLDLWREHILHRFGILPQDGAFPGNGALAIDSQGNLYGTTNVGGNGGYGIVYKLVRNVAASSGSQWPEVIIHDFLVGGGGDYPVGVILDQAGNLYGATALGGSPLCECGVVYKLSPQPDGIWQYTLLHTFDGSDGFNPAANLTIGPDGNLYGTTVVGGQYGGGVVFQIKLTP